MGPGEDGRIGEEQVPMPDQDAHYAPPRILVQEAVHLFSEDVQEHRQSIDHVEGEVGIGYGELAQGSLCHVPTSVSVSATRSTLDVVEEMLVIPNSSPWFAIPTVTC